MRSISEYFSFLATQPPALDYRQPGREVACTETLTDPPWRHAPQRVWLSLCEMDIRSGKALPTRDPEHCEILPFHNRVAASLAYT